MRCEVYDASFPGGIGVDVSISTTTAEPLNVQRSLCEKLGCNEKAADGVCDRECDSYACGYDGHDCSFHLPIWSNCSAIKNVSLFYLI